jgi:hypothetical protein
MQHLAAWGFTQFATWHPYAHGYTSTRSIPPLLARAT